MDRRLSTLLFTSVFSAAVAAAPNGNVPGGPDSKPRMLGAGNPFTTGDLPRGRLRDRLESLPSVARNRAIDWLHRFEFPEADASSLDVDEEGGVFYVDENLPTPEETEQAVTGDSTAFATANAWAVDEAFTLHSRPGAPNVVFLDFDGHTFTGTAWSSGTIVARAFDLDGDRSSFNAAERAAIAEIWHRVAEDLAAFDIDVTTEEPPAFGPYVGRVLITSRADTYGNPMPADSAGGVAYVGVWGGSNYTYYSPALVYYDNLASSTTYIAEAASHEFGHNLSLSHDGTSTASYYTGHGSGATSWAPIMGVGYYRNVTQWSRGEYTDANNTQDDIAIIRSKLSMLDDDHGDTLADASALLVEANGGVQVSSPEVDPKNLDPQNKGVIQSTNDVDMFRFTVPAGAVDLTINPAWEAFYRTDRRGANLDIQARLLDESGAVVATSDPATDTFANIAANVDGGTYYLEIKGVGSNNYSNYGSAGMYFIAGSVPAGAVSNATPNAQFNYACTELNCSFTDGSSDSDGNIASWQWNFGYGTTSTAQHPSHAFTASGSYGVSLTVTDNGGASAMTTRDVSVNVSAVDTENPVVSITSPADRATVSGRVTLSASATDNDQVTSVAIFVDGSERCAGTSSASCTWNLRKVAAGSYTIRADAVDASGNSSSTSITVTVADGGGSGGGKGGGGKGGGKAK